MKRVSFLSFVFFTFLFLDCAFAQQAKSVLAVALSPNVTVNHRLPINAPVLHSTSSLSLPIYRVPVSYYKMYMIRVLQTDTRQFNQIVKDSNPKLYVAKGADHDGYDYYLPTAFEKKNIAQEFMDRLPGDIAMKAVLVKMEPNKLKCHCFGKF